MEPQQDATNDMLITLLSRLPVELRLYIYRLSLPCTRHRKRKIHLDYIGDGRWMATSKPLFQEAAPLIFSKPCLFAHTKLREGDNLLKYFDALVERIFVDDASWVLKQARPMVQIFAVILRVPHFDNMGDFAERLPSYFSNLESFTGLKELDISLGPEHLPWQREYYSRVQDIFRRRDSREALRDSPILRTFASGLMGLKAEVPRSCEVRWRFDAAGIPCTPSYINDRVEVLQHLVDVNCCLQGLWGLVLDASDEELVKLLVG